MEYNFIQADPAADHLFGTPNNGIGIYYDDSPKSTGAITHDGPGWYGNVVFFDHVTIGFGPKATMEEVKKDCIEHYEKMLKDYGSDYDL